METILLDRSDGIATITLNRPELKNAANGLMWEELLAAFDDVASTPSDRVLVITGAGDGFCSGADLSFITGSGEKGERAHFINSMRRVADCALTLHRIAKPTIAKVNGVAAGAGCNLALGCDLIVASDTARFSEIFAKRGLSIDFGGSWLLPRLVGLHKAKELAFFADILSAQDAAALGLVNHVVPAAELDGFVDDWARRLVAGPPLALSMTKTMLNNGVDVSMAQALEDEARCQSVNIYTKDVKEALAAFAEKRDPTFTGH
jgi:2-(1,2-epoxy-1,2-dihydrophenyl)acetyl-CoA isomerase